MGTVKRRMNLGLGGCPDSPFDTAVVVGLTSVVDILSSSRDRGPALVAGRSVDEKSMWNERVES
jgi:hypothetical protein